MNYYVRSVVILSLFFKTVSYDANLVIFVDNLHQETSKTQEINITHQSITVLQQKASLLLVSTGIWKNIIGRKKSFAARLENPESIESAIFSMYQTTNQELQAAWYNLALINQKLSKSWFEQKYPLLAQLSAEQLDQLRFDFLCYIFNIDMSQWRVYNAREGMLLFVPGHLNYQINESYKITDESDLCKHADKKSNVVKSLEKLIPLNKSNRWVVYLSGHGHPKGFKQGANIAGLKIKKFKELLEFFNDNLQLKLLVYSSCYGGGVHTIEPYANIQLHYPVIVTSLTDAPIYGFGFFEGVKLPPYDDEFKLTPQDVLKNHGLLPSALQNYAAFFKRAWKGLFDLPLIQSISRFFMCDYTQCHVQKVENFPLIRNANTTIFTPLRDRLMFKLVQQSITPYSTMTLHKPLLLYTKKVKRIKMNQSWPIISMIPGVQSHEILELLAPQVPLSALITQTFLSLEDMEGYKNFSIKKLVCFDDLFGTKKTALLEHVVIINQKNFMPKFFTDQAQALIYCKFAGVSYLLVFDDQKITKTLILEQEQSDAMDRIEKFVELGSVYESQDLSNDILTFEAYLNNKEYQQGLIDECVREKVCRKL